MLTKRNMDTVVIVLDLTLVQGFHCQIFHEFGKNVIIFEVDNSSSIHADDKKKNIFNSCRRSTKWIKRLMLLK